MYPHIDQSDESIVVAGGAEVGWYVTVIVKGVEKIENDDNDLLVLTSLLPHEHRYSTNNYSDQHKYIVTNQSRIRMSVVNIAVKRHISSGSLPVKSKSRLIFQVGWRRFAANPIFSQHTNGNKHKYERYFREGPVVMTTFAPISFPPASALVYQVNINQRVILTR